MNSPPNSSQTGPRTVNRCPDAVLRYEERKLALIQWSAISHDKDPGSRRQALRSALLK